MLKHPVGPQVGACKCILCGFQEGLLPWFTGAYRFTVYEAWRLQAGRLQRWVGLQAGCWVELSTWTAKRLSQHKRRDAEMSFRGSCLVGILLSSAGQGTRPHRGLCWPTTVVASEADFCCADSQTLLVESPTCPLTRMHCRSCAHVIQSVGATSCCTNMTCLRPLRCGTPRW